MDSKIYNKKILIKRNRINILMLTASLSLTGTHRILMDILEGLDKERFHILIAYKPHYPGPGDDLAAEIIEKGFEVCPLRGRHLFAFTGLWDLYKILSANKIDIIHCWDSLSIVAGVMGKLVGAKLVNDIGNPPICSSRRHLYAKKISSLFMDGIVFQSNESQMIYRKLGVDFMRPYRQTVIYNCIDMSKLPDLDCNRRTRLRKTFGFSNDEIILTNLGMYNEQKSQEFLIRALPEIRSRVPKVKLILIGWGPREDILRKEIERLQLEGRVILTGKKSRNEVFDFLSISDIYVSSSLWEGLPVAVLEAMAFGLPIVATDIIGNREAVKNSETGYLVPPRNPTTLAKSISHLIENPEIRGRMGDAGRERVEKVFSPKRFLLEHEKFYQTILANIKNKRLN